jgi:RNA polymerase sigma-54 factor
LPLELKLGLKLSQKLIMTPSLQQAIKLLQMSKLELVEEVNQELTENPVLEEQGPEPASTDGEASEGQERAESEETAAKESETAEDDTRSDDIDLEAYFQDEMEAAYVPRQFDREIKEGTSFEATLTKPPNLSDYLEWQVQMDSASDRIQQISRCIIGNIDARGYLQASLEEIAELAECSGPEAEEALRFVQGFDPPGIAARDLEECLLLQLRHLHLDDSPAVTIVREHLERLQEHRYREVADRMKMPVDEIRHCVEIIRHLDPRPGLKYGADNSQYVTPDVYVVKVDDGYTVILNEDGLPRLRISPVYRRLLDRSNSSVNREERDYVREKYRAAFRLLKSLEERQRTIYKVACSIVKYQRGFLDAGFEKLRPLVLKDVARDIEMHESTVSRVVNNKYMHTHRGLFEMRFFFHSGIQSSRGEDVSSLAVKQRIRKLVEQEDPRRPLSDSTIVKLLEKENLHIARRTVAKYREELRIPSSTLRKRSQER